MSLVAALGFLSVLLLMPETRPAQIAEEE